ncbi:MAG: type VII secretion target [Chloroflexota bacterium]
MADEIFMDVPKVKEIAGSFKGMNEQLKQASKVLQMNVAMLKASALVGMAGNLALAHFLEGLQPQIERYAAHCEEIAGDLEQSAEAYERGDAQGAAKFH